jgi:hypothetical protein
MTEILILTAAVPLLSGAILFYLSNIFVARQCFVARNYFNR